MGCADVLAGLKTQRFLAGSIFGIGKEFYPMTWTAGVFFSSLDLLTLFNNCFLSLQWQDIDNVLVFLFHLWQIKGCLNILAICLVVACEDCSQNF